ncbi:MAG: pantoate--beta-alanine ligase, partial [Phycisphaerales bacterium]
LFAAAEEAARGERDVARLVEAARTEIHEAGPAQIEYVEIVDAETLEAMKTIDRPARMCLAVRIGSCRLIDNISVDVPPEGS